MKRFGASIAAGIVVALGIGCGSGGGNGSSTVAAVSVDPSVTHAQYRQQANAICNEAKKEMIIALQNQAKKEGRASVLQISPEVQTEILLDGLRTNLQRLEELSAPAKDQQQIEEFLSTFHTVVDLIDEKDLNSVQKFQPVLLRISKVAEPYGLHGCGYG
ncbi:MAG TPA: hypothetical protein VFX35_09905 [Solirubrobacterales bacterium]|nr:hypothetical protein [Solirubrobacterales bacterium]